MGSRLTVLVGGPGSKPPPLGRYRLVEKHSPVGGRPLPAALRGKEAKSNRLISREVDLTCRCFSSAVEGQGGGGAGDGEPQSAARTRRPTSTGGPRPCRSRCKVPLSSVSVIVQLRQGLPFREKTLSGLPGVVRPQDPGTEPSSLLRGLRPDASSPPTDCTWTCFSDPPAPTGAHRALVPLHPGTLIFQEAQAQTTLTTG